MSDVSYAYFSQNLVDRLKSTIKAVRHPLFRIGPEGGSSSTGLRITMVQPLLISYCALSAAATLAYLAWGWARAKGGVHD